MMPNDEPTMSEEMTSVMMLLTADTALGCVKMNIPAYAKDVVILSSAKESLSNLYTSSQ